MPVTLTWTGQPMAPGHLRCETGWRGHGGTAGRIAAALRDWTMLRFEVTEEPSEGNDGERYMATPELGVLRATMSANGDVLVQEDRLRALVARCNDLPSLQHGLERMLGAAWDRELEPYRQAGEGAPVRWLNQVV